MSDLTISKDKWELFEDAKFDLQHFPPMECDGTTDVNEMFRRWGSHADIVMCYHAFISGEKISMLSASGFVLYTVKLIKKEGN